MPTSPIPPNYVTQSEFGRLVELVEENTIITRQLESSTADVVSAFSAMQGGFKVLETIGKLGKPFAVLGAVGAGIALAWFKFKLWFFGG